MIRPLLLRVGVAPSDGAVSRDGRDAVLEDFPPHPAYREATQIGRMRQTRHTRVSQETTDDE
jgi:hypothetical protein